MSLKYINAGFFITVIFFSAVHNLKHGKQQLVQEPIFSEIKRNITLVNHLLQDLLQKYALLKQLAKDEKENTNHKERNANEFFKGDSKIRVRAKVRLSKARKPFETTLFQNDKTLKRSEFGTTKNEKPIVKAIYDDDSPSSDSRKLTSKTKRVKYLVTQNQRELLERNVKIKESDQNVFSPENTMKENPKEVTDPHDVEKLLVIHLGTRSHKEEIIKENRASTFKQDFVLTTNQKMETITKSILFESETTGSHESDIQDEQEMQREMQRVKQLRAAVGNACSLIVVKKCQKAIKLVLKDVCKSDRKCSHDFNDDFTSNGVAACNSEFKQPIKNRVRYVDFEHKYSGEEQYGTTHQQQSQEVTGAQFIDYTREGDLLVDMTCMQALSKVKEPNVDIMSVKNAKTQDVNLLRDRYEKACRQASYKKCRSACNSAAVKTCNKHDCITEKTKALKYCCKRRCKESNSVVGGGNSNSGSSSSQSQSQSQTQSQSGSSETS